MSWDALLGGVNEFIRLLDTPSSFAGASKFYPRVKSTLDGLEFIDHRPKMSWFALAANQGQSSVAKFDIASDTVPPNMLETTNGIIILSVGKLFQGNGAGTFTLRLEFGGVIFATEVIPVATVQQIDRLLFVFAWLQNNGTVNSQTGFLSYLFLGSNDAHQLGSGNSNGGAIDTTVNQVIKLTGQFSVSDVLNHHDRRSTIFIHLPAFGT